MTKVQTLEQKSVAPALTRGFVILDLISREPGLGFTEIRDHLGLPNSSCHHLVTTLCQLGVLQQSPDRGYVLGLRLFELGANAANQRHLHSLALPMLNELAQEVQLTCHLGVMEGAEAVYLLKAESRSDIRVNTWVGKRLSLHTSSLCKALLAGLPEVALNDVLANATWEQKTSKTITDPEIFKKHLLEVHERGWAFDDEEDAVNIRCVAAPIFDVQGHAIAAVSAVGTILDITQERLPSLAEQVCATARKISQQVGYAPT
ncbi:IclR family transcriptional regulator [Propionivibrio sp.]|uniref:IclR family transcriptional regulator n=1 Tax=Propionivibrio sp. TaxID=2212460 RepID=UPI0039E31F75